MSYKIALISLGCPKNLVNSEQMLYLLAESGFELVDDPNGADAAIVNTCGFIDSAKSEAIENILELGELKKAGALKKIIVTGCLSERYKDEIAAELPEIDALLGVGSFGEIVDAVRAVMDGGHFSAFGDKNAPIEELGRIVSTGPGWAYLRIAEGCSNHCAYCAIPDIRGRFRSRPIENIVDEAAELAAAGYKELILIAQDVTMYGRDLYHAPALSELIRKIAEIDGVEWIRLHYLYPDEFDDELIDTIASEPKVVKYLDIPIQHINDSILRRMNRRGTGEEVRTLLAALRERIPGVVLRSSFIVGLPGEGEAEFDQLCRFLAEAKIERAGVFPFSPEDGTPAAEMTDRCSPEEAVHRAELVDELQSRIIDDYCASRIGKVIRVLCEGYDPDYGLLWGRSEADSPEIDGRVLFSGEAAAGDFVNIMITGSDVGDLIGEAI